MAATAAGFAVTTGRVARRLLWGLLVAAPAAQPGPITFDTALPVARDVYTARIQAIDRQRDDARSPGREVDVSGIVAALGYGFTRTWTGIATVPYLEKSLRAAMPAGITRRRVRGLGDARLLARYSWIERNAPGALVRVAPLAGVVAPIGESDARDALGELPRPLQPGTGAWAAVAGIVVTRQTLARELDLAATWTEHGRDEGFEPGDALELAASYQQRLPWPARGARAFAYAVLEAKAIHRQDDVVDGARVDSGGTEWRLTPGAQYVTRRWVIEAAVELPLADNLPADAQRDERFVHIGVRFNF